MIYKYIYSIYLKPKCNYNILHIKHLKKKKKSITSKLHSIIQKCIENKIDANTRIQLGNTLFNV